MNIDELRSLVTELRSKLDNNEINVYDFYEEIVTSLD